MISQEGRHRTVRYRYGGGEEGKGGKESKGELVPHILLDCTDECTDQ